MVHATERRVDASNAGTKARKAEDTLQRLEGVVESQGVAQGHRPSVTYAIVVQARTVRVRG